MILSYGLGHAWPAPDITVRGLLWCRREPVGLSAAGQRGSRGNNRQQRALGVVAGSVPHFRVSPLLLFARLS